MSLRRLYVENWKTFDTKEFIFSDGINIIEGKNFSGKTSFIQALYYGLFKETNYKRLTAKELKKENTRDAKIEIDLVFGKKSYRIRRNLSGDKVIKVDSHLYKLEEGEETEELEAISKKNEVLNKLSDLLNASKDFVQNINFIQEDSIHLFLVRPEFKIVDDINKILQLDYLNELKEYCEKADKGLTKKIKDQEKKLKDYEDFKKTNPQVEEIDKEILKSKENIKEKQKKLEVLKENQMKLARLKELTKDEKLLFESIENLTEHHNKIEEELKDFQKQIKNIEEADLNLKYLEKNELEFTENKEQLIKLNKEKEVLQVKSTKFTKREGVVEKQRKDIENLMEDKEKMLDDIKSLNYLEEETERLRQAYYDYRSFNQKIQDLQESFENDKNVLVNFKEGKCPITDGECPVASNFISQYTENLSKKEKELKVMNEKLQTMVDPEKQFQNAIKQRDTLVKTRQDLDKINKDINIIQTELRESSDLSNNAEFSTQIEELEKKISTTQDDNKNLEKGHDEYIRLVERVKNKNSLIEKMGIKQKDTDKVLLQISEVKQAADTKKKEIANFKKEKSISEDFDISEEETLIKSLEDEITQNQNDIHKNEATKQSVKDQIKRILHPFDNKNEFVEKLKKLVHQNYRISFFRDVLESTLNHLRVDKLRAIKERCNHMWSEFKHEPGMDSIDWDSKFLPIIQIGGNQRNLYQLSASERILVYFSIRAALISELGPNYFMVIDNLLSTFTKDNQETMLSLLREVIKNTNVHQIIFTGFEIPSDIECDNFISI